MKYTVYRITNKTNRKIYVGVHRTTNLNDGYMGSGDLIKKAIKKYGTENFKKEYIAIFDNPEEMYTMETKLVNETFIKRSDTYNIKEGGLGGDTSKFVPYNEDSYRKSISEGMLKFFKENPDKRAEFAERLSLHRVSFEGKKHTEEAKRKIGEKNSKCQIGKKNSQYGTMWITNDKENKKVPKTESIPIGWRTGRKMGL